MNSLAIRNDQHITTDLWDKQLQQIKEIYGKKLTQGEWETFVGVGKATGLNPFLREIWAVKYGSDPAQIFIGRDGYRRSAQANDNYDYHQVDAIYSNDDFTFDVKNAEVTHKYNIKDRGSIVGAYCLVKRKNSSKPIYVYVDFKEYDKGKSTWKAIPSTMIKKVAEAQCLRMAFQALFGGTYDESEQWDKGTNEIKYQPIIEPKKIEQKTKEQKVDLLETDLQEIYQCDSLEELHEVSSRIYKKWLKECDGDAVRAVMAAKDKRKGELQVAEFNQEIDAATGEVIDG